MPEFDFDSVFYGQRLWESRKEDLEKVMIIFANGMLFLTVMDLEGEFEFEKELSPGKVDDLIAVLTQWKAWRNA